MPIHAHMKMPTGVAFFVKKPYFPTGCVTFVDYVLHVVWELRDDPTLQSQTT